MTELSQRDRVLVGIDALPADVLGLTDRIAYPERVEQARQRSGTTEAAIHGPARVGGHPVVLVAFHRRLLRHPEFRSGAYRLGLVESMSSGDGER
ncbi:hypothetical protein AB0C01_29950 [Micromonospora sp. NPDC048905]|uniref:hypothetical protein n=1 Tax=unclassified Micromonospora TaxID=2617518 RepID=UPI003403F1FE